MDEGKIGLLVTVEEYEVIKKSLKNRRSMLTLQAKDVRNDNDMLALRNSQIEEVNNVICRIGGDLRND